MDRHRKYLKPYSFALLIYTTFLFFDRRKPRIQKGPRKTWRLAKNGVSGRQPSRRRCGRAATGRTAELAGVAGKQQQHSKATGQGQEADG